MNAALEQTITAAELIITNQFASTSMVQRRLRITHARAVELMTALEALGLLGPASETGGRHVLVPTHAREAFVDQLLAAAAVDR